MNYDVFISYSNKNLLMAEAVRHFLEERRLKCFFAPRNISEPLWADTIADAIQNSKAFVVLISEDSLKSVEVAKEISLATSRSFYIFPFRIDSSEIQGGMRYHLTLFSWIDAVTPPIEKRLNELADRVENAVRYEKDNIAGVAANRNSSVQSVVNKIKSPSEEFIGREKEIQEIDNIFSSGKNSVFLCGMGGIGKSEIAKMYAQKNIDKYISIVFASYEKDLMHLVADDSKIEIENFRQSAVSGGQGETTEDYYKRKIKLLKTLLKDDSLLIIDNFDVEFDDKFEDVYQLECKKIWTTRLDFSAYGYSTVNIGPIESTEDLEKLYCSIDNRHTAEIEKQAIRDIISLLDRHTYAISLTAAQSMAMHITPSVMLEKLKNEGLKIKTRSTFGRGYGSQRATSYDFIKSLFNFSELDDISTDILRNLSCMPLDGVSVDLFLECADIEDFGCIQRLIDLNWIQYDYENDKISLHTIVRQIAREELKPSTENCSTLLNKTFEWANNAWNKKYEENVLHSPVIYAILEYFTEPGIEWLDQFEEFATFAWIQGRFDLSEKCELYLYNLAVEHYGSLHKITGERALRVAAVYHNQGDYAKARPWYIKGLEIQETIDKESVAAHYAREKVARSNVQLGNFEEAEEQFRYNYEVISRIHAENISKGVTGEKLRKSYINLASVSNHLAHVYCCLKRYDEALPYVQQAYDYYTADKVESSLVVYPLMNFAQVYYGLNNYEKAIECIEKSIEINMFYHGDKTMDHVRNLEIKGDLYAVSGRTDEALEAYSTAVAVREKYFPSNIKAIDNLNEKIEYVTSDRTDKIKIADNWV
ncbi:MAG: toll/interleukin-1 receptor domain-containing protein [Oscillospiraceae bacterium]|nr:toll/interleukin-1 receptor domain-containing protein [Oscillospiraceae bacterium]